jgi:hypothetical protein
MSMTRARKWAQSFLADESDDMRALGENFEYYLNHVTEFETGELAYTDLPGLDDVSRLISHACVMFGTKWAASRANIAVVTGVDRELVGVYGREENARRRANQSMELSVEQLPLSDADIEDDLAALSESATLQGVGENLCFLVEHYDDIEAGGDSFTDAPNFNTSMKALITYSALFGLIWEYSHPSIVAVLGPGTRLIELFHSKRAAEARAEDDTFLVQRVNVQDGDLPPEAVVDEIGDFDGLR